MYEEVRAPLSFVAVARALTAHGDHCVCLNGFMLRPNI